MAASEEAGSRKQMLQAYSYVLLWVFVSAWVILFNKYLLSVFGFPYPVSLTAMHMAFSSILASLCIKLGLVKTVEMSTSLYMRSVVPIGLLFALVLWLGNAAYLYLSVSFIQMLKASSPMWVFFVGLVFKTETFTYSSLATVSVVGIGIGIASYGEINFVVIGVLYQVASIGLESIRITLVQILLQRKGIKLNPIQTLYYVAPCCFVFLTVPLIMFELPTIMNDAAVEISVPIFFANCISAFVLNLSSFLLIGKTSALTLNIAGVLKDWLLILLSALIFLNPVTTLNLIGYSIAFVGVGWYNHQKRQQLRGCQDGSAASGPHREPAHPKQRLLSGGEQGMLAAEHRHDDGMNGSIPALSAGLSSRVADSESGLLQAAAVSGGAGKPASS